jgi:hypothetical protein
MPSQPANPVPAAFAAGENLVRNLESQADGYRTYAGLLAEQRQALMQGDLERLGRSNAAIDAAVSDLLRLEVDREIVVRSILEAAGKPRRPDSGWFTRPAEAESAVKCEELAGHLPPETGKALLRARDTLRAILQEIERAARINAALAQNGQRLIATTMASLTTVPGNDSRERLQSYNPRGEALSASGRRQIRNLVNRSA